MVWQALLKPEVGQERFVAPWFGQKQILSPKGRCFSLKGRRPREHGWYFFEITKPKIVRCVLGEEASAPDGWGESERRVQGYAVGDRLILDSIGFVNDPSKIIEHSRSVYFLDPGLDRFSRVSAVEYESGDLLFYQQEFPLGPESLALDAFLDGREDLSGIKEVTPALHFSFLFERWVQEEQRARIRILEEHRLEQERLLREAEMRAEIERSVGDGASRRAMALVDFEAAAGAALRLSGAELLDVRDGYRGEKTIRFRYRERRFCSVINGTTLEVIDSGICLVGNDRLFTLESLPSVIGMAMDEGVLHVFRRVDDYYGYGDDD